MVEIIAVVRPDKTSATKRAILEAGYPGYTCVKVMGRGKLPVDVTLPDGSTAKTSLLPKRLFVIAVEDEGTDAIVEAVMKANSTGSPGDGKIFVVPVETTYNVRTGAHHNNAE